MEINLQQGKTIITVIEQENLDKKLLGAKILLTDDSTDIRGSLQLPWLEEQAVRLVQENQTGGMFMVANIINPDAPEQKATVMIDPYLETPELTIFGGGHIAQPLANIGHLLGYRVTVVDDRPDFTSPERFEGVYKSICCSFDEIENYLKLGPASSVVIATRGHINDMDCLRKVIKYPVAYLGMIGSRRKVKAIKEQLLEDGIEMKKIEKVHMPIGLDIGAQTPAEIAVCIAAEMVKERRGGSTAPLVTVEECCANKEDVNNCEIPVAADKDALQEAIKAAFENTPAALATIFKTKGSTPRKAGARMLVYRDGRTVGTIGGGCCGESEVRVQAISVIDEEMPRIHRISMTADVAAAEGMSCGGTLEVFIEPVTMFAEAFKGE
ncbi:MAG: XdhC family protein [Desulfotomaculaceae bacterium]|nr:XdhC family protein [Desulfotomaculaceae bacterium]